MSDSSFRSMRMARLVRPPGTPGIREWADSNGHRIGGTGMIPSHVREAYLAANPEVIEVVRVFAQDSGVGPDVYDWPDDGPLGPVYAITFVRGLDEREVLHRLGAEEQDIRLISDEEVAEHQGAENPEEIITVARLGDWVVTECKGRRASQAEHVKVLSIGGGEAVAVQRDRGVHDRFIYTVGGQVVTSFAPSRPFDRQGSDPDKLNGYLRMVGIDPARNDIVDNAVPAALALASRISGVVIIDISGDDLPSRLAGRLSGVKVLNRESSRLGAVVYDP
ncbi:hypothetical protein HD597_009506 [Nonomuraea thailandensis]|uniref:Lsr2 DNA-binding domain-containing protein n=1 Tax=Nonomuraea thailandensis TaxID=1188745 RepID=A0A9X2KA22_9ACTN|nr:DUF6461 domain-containing protein [Nonomuraea thailandensis]MCP2362486.1 hypothetical protein [Nonomuraea thailandensis]